MNSGMYASLSGALVSVQRLDVLAHNLANVNTPGYKKDCMKFEAVMSSAGSASPSGYAAEAPVLVAESTSIDYSAGPVSTTGNTFDLALDGEGFFVINTPNGKAYTRQGNFRLNSSGNLVTVDGYEVMGKGGPVNIQGSTVSFSAEGKISVEGVETGALDIVTFEKPYNLRKIGQGLLEPNDPGITAQPAAKTAVMQGRLEGSNVSAVEEMVQLIDTSRFFEACQRVIQNYDSMTGKAVNELGKV